MVSQCGVEELDWRAQSTNWESDLTAPNCWECCSKSLQPGSTI